MFSHFWIELNTYKYVVIEQEVHCFNMQIQCTIREKMDSNNNFLCKYSIKQLNPPCL
jgi:hypothetical protein